jgi:preprotein translocase subunit SecD
MLRIGLRDDARKRFANMTRTMVGKPMEVRFEGRVLMAPIIAEPITGGSIDIDDPGSGRGADLLTQLTAPC